MAAKTDAKQGGSAYPPQIAGSVCFEIVSDFRITLL